MKSNLKLLRKCGHNIRHIKNPSRSELLAAVRQKATSIHFIKDEHLTEELVFNALRQNISIHKHLKSRFDLKKIEKYKDKIFRSHNYKNDIFK